MSTFRLSLAGSIVAIVTPMHADGSLDVGALQRLIDWHAEEGTDGIVIVGTTGESATVSVVEHVQLIRDAVRFSAGRVPIIAGCGGNSTTEAIELTRAARDAGAMAGLSVVPYYNKPTQEGLYRHFRAIAEAVDLPLILYNVPGRTVADMSNDTVLRLAQIPGIVGIKDATGDLARGADLLARAPRDFVVYSGDDPTAVPYMWLGARGVISVTANLAPRSMHLMCAAAIAGDIPTARQLHFRLLPLHRAVLMEPNPIPSKWALQRMGRIEGGIRLPLVPLSEASHDRMLDAMRHAGVI